MQLKYCFLNHPMGKLLIEIQSMLWCIKKLWFQHFWDIFRWRVVHSGRHSHSSRWDWSRLSASRSFNHQSLCSNLQEYWITLQEIQFCKIPCLLTWIVSLQGVDSTWLIKLKLNDCINWNTCIISLQNQS